MLKIFLFLFRSVSKKSKITNVIFATEDLSNTTSRMEELKALCYKEKLKFKKREVEAKESIAEQLKLLIANKFT